MIIDEEQEGYEFENMGDRYKCRLCTGTDALF